MNAPKVQDVDEAIGWIKEGKTYHWIIEQYQEKYDIETKPAMWSNFRRKHGLALRVPQHTTLIPWQVKEQHSALYICEMLRTESRFRAGLELSEMAVTRLTNFKNKLRTEDVVVTYDRDTAEGFSLVPRRPGIDMDFIRQPPGTADDAAEPGSSLPGSA